MNLQVKHPFRRVLESSCQATTRAFVTVRPLRTHDPRGRRVYMKPAAAGSSHRLLEIQMAQRKLPFFFLLIVALAVFSTLLGGAPVRAEIVLLMVKCREYVAPGPRKDPSKECCADEVQKSDVVCFCKNIPSAVEKKISMEEPNAESVLS
ncbi:hypothetical protein B296_00056152 [Ensete ventricosum]|uniref:Bifunctional inhibitor/plant lipid transfer protein/seed storage helical domain-containing protein n=1 Tax=Ensete ventricosum TaxID=4639 RepID=A0A426X8S1_ENSVE|nr:hypothetical protein B296_00056152 [Ensete ventricosum]